MRKILYIARTRMSADETERRTKVLESIANRDSQIDIRGGTSVPSIESAYEGYLTIPEACKTAIQAVKEGYQAIVVGCFSDPGLDAVRELVNIPVVGPGQTAVHFASMLGERFTILATGPRRRSLSAGRHPVLSTKFASRRGIGMSVLEVREHKQKAIELLIQEGKKAIEDDDADVAILGCLSLAFHKIDEDLKGKLPIPIVNPVKVAVKTAEILVDLGLAHSKLAFPNPKQVY